MTSSMTALVSAFARAYHTEHSAAPVYRDPLARRLLSKEEYQSIGQNMAQGIAFFAPNFSGTPEQALRYVVDHQLAPSPLGRAVFARRALENALRLGTRQYWLLGAGYDTFPYRLPSWAQSLTVLELDRPEALADKARRLRRAGISIPRRSGTSRRTWPTPAGCKGFSSALPTTVRPERCAPCWG